MSNQVKRKGGAFQGSKLSSVANQSRSTLKQAIARNGYPQDNSSTKYESLGLNKNSKGAINTL